MDEEKTPQKAIRLFQSGENVSEICRQLNKSRKWFYKWRKRFLSKPLEEWYKDESKSPKHFPKKRSPYIEQEILAVRKKLQKLNIKNKSNSSSII